MLNTSLSVSDSLTLKNGSFDLNNHDVVLGTKAAIHGENERNRITGSNGGNIIMQVWLKAPQQFEPGNIGIAFSSPEDIGVVTIKRSHHEQKDAAGIKTVLRYFEVNPFGNGHVNATMRFRYLNSELNQLNKERLTVFDRGNIQSNWKKHAGSVKRSTNYVELNRTLSAGTYALAVESTPSASNEVELYPVPAQTSTTLQLVSNIGYSTKISILSADAKLVQQQQANMQKGMNRFVIDLSKLSKGTYYLRFDLPSGEQKLIPFIKH
jgi:hypothetical protein